MENKSATKTPKTERAWTKSGSGQNQEANRKGAARTKGTGHNKGSGHNKGRTERNSKQKGTDPKISPYKKYVVMITAA